MESLALEVAVDAAVAMLVVVEAAVDVTVVVLIEATEIAGEQEVEPLTRAIPTVS